MFTVLWLIPVLPFIGFLVLATVGARLPRRAVAAIGVGSVSLAAVIALLITVAFLRTPPADNAVTQTLWTWWHIGSIAPTIAFRLDPLSLVMTLVVTFVGALIHLYSTEFMEGDEGYSRFFAYLNLFVGSMLTLLLADNLLLLYLGWEGVGLCSYLLIGFWYKDPANNAAAMKAFIVTRIGDAAMAVGLFLIATQLGTLAIQPFLARAQATWPVGSTSATIAAALLLGGALGKSAQLPLQTWLPDAMAGPTPVSALIHAATMVTAGVYLIARTHVLFALAPTVQTAVAVIGALTLLVAGFSALTQWDLKRVLAYSTISQIGYMFLALGVGGWWAAIFHFMTHAFFKALLFLAAGVVIEAVHHEHSMFRMGGLRRELPLTYWTFLIGSCSLAALPLVTAGFYSKDLILWFAWATNRGSVWLWLAGIAGAFLTSLYTFRMVFLTFFGPQHTAVSRRPGLRMQIPLVTLAVLSIVGGFVEIPAQLGNLPLFSEFMRPVLPEPHLAAGLGTSNILMAVSGIIVLAGILLAYVVFLRKPAIAEQLTATAWGATLHRFWFSGWGFDWVYDRLIVRPYVRLAEWSRGDVADAGIGAVAAITAALSRALTVTETGRVRWYAMGIAGGAAVVVALVVFL